MSKYSISALIISIGLYCIPAISAEEDFSDLVIYTENYAPYNFEEKGVAQGLNVDLIVEIFKRAGIQKSREDIVILPWARGYTETQRRKNTVLFTTTRNPTRETLFKWVGPIGTSNMALIARKDRKVSFEGTVDFNKYTYATMQKVRGELALLAAGTNTKNIIHINSPEAAGQILARGRVDAWAYDRTASFWVLQMLGYDPADFEVVYSFDIYPQYFAFNKDTSPALIGKMQKALDDIIDDGTFTAIMKTNMIVSSGLEHFMLSAPE